jgi:hypothetical protein
MNEAQLVMAHGDSSRLMGGPPTVDFKLEKKNLEGLRGNLYLEA